MYWGDEYHLAADTLSGGRHITAETVKRGKEETSRTTGMRTERELASKD